MRARGLIDTGAMLALLDADDRWHARCAVAFAGLRLPLATTGAVLAEFFPFGVVSITDANAPVRSETCGGRHDRSRNRHGRR